VAQLQPPARRPCGACPYRLDVPSGVWAASEYAKLPDYDRDTPYQPTGVFQCHLTEHKGASYRICAGWAGCHDTENLLSLRIAVSAGLITPETAEATCDYESPVPLFASGAEAAAHGIRDLANPSAAACAAANKIVRIRPDVLYALDPPPKED
jgi:hypothetical protein